uniref:Putative secreted peptide n=1 Tax=Anopheles braziliensis TaxID=58242 RepID=A0A2M3ZMA3_9DIPT
MRHRRKMDFRSSLLLLLFHFRLDQIASVWLFLLFRKQKLDDLFEKESSTHFHCYVQHSTRKSCLTGHSLSLIYTSSSFAELCV